MTIFIILNTKIVEAEQKFDCWKADLEKCVIRHHFNLPWIELIIWGHIVPEMALEMPWGEPYDINFIWSLGENGKFGEKSAALGLQPNESQISVGSYPQAHRSQSLCSAFHALHAEFGLNSHPRDCMAAAVVEPTGVNSLCVWWGEIHECIWNSKIFMYRCW